MKREGECEDKNEGEVTMQRKMNMFQPIFTLLMKVSRQHVMQRTSFRMICTPHGEVSQLEISLQPRICSSASFVLRSAFAASREAMSDLRVPFFVSRALLYVEDTIQRQPFSKSALLPFAKPGAIPAVATARPRAKESCYRGRLCP